MTALKTSWRSSIMLVTNCVTGGRRTVSRRLPKESMLPLALLRRLRRQDQQRRPGKKRRMKNGKISSRLMRGKRKTGVAMLRLPRRPSPKCRPNLLDLSPS